jgi:serine/threonine-protein kinase
VPVYAAGYDDGHFFLAMRLVRGQDLADVVSSGGPLPEARAMRIVGQIASALYAVHSEGIVHRDVKPHNVLLWNAGHHDEHVFLTDFGIAKALADTIGLSATVAGTRGYMAPEVLAGGRVSPACDQYSLACLAYELLCGELPLQGVTDDDSAAPVPLVLRAPGVSREVREIIERALAQDPAARFPDVRAFVLADRAARDAFEVSRSITETVSQERSPSEVVTGLYTRHGLSDAQIAEIADLERSEVVRLRRRAARRAIAGD